MTKLKTPIVTKLKNSNCYISQNLKLGGKNSQTQIVTKLKNSNFDKTQKLNLWQTQKTKIVKNSQAQIYTKLKNSSSDTSTTDEMFSGQLL